MSDFLQRMIDAKIQVTGVIRPRPHPVYVPAAPQYPEPYGNAYHADFTPVALTRDPAQKQGEHTDPATGISSLPARAVPGSMVPGHRHYKEDTAIGTSQQRGNGRAETARNAVDTGSPATQAYPPAKASTGGEVRPARTARATGRSGSFPQSRNASGGGRDRYADIIPEETPASFLDSVASGETSPVQDIPGSRLDPPENGNSEPAGGAWYTPVEKIPGKKSRLYERQRAAALPDPLPDRPENPDVPADHRDSRVSPVPQRSHRMSIQADTIRAGQQQAGRGSEGVPDSSPDLNGAPAVPGTGIHRKNAGTGLLPAPAENPEGRRSDLLLLDRSGTPEKNPDARAVDPHSSPLPLRLHQTIRPTDPASPVLHPGVRALTGKTHAGPPVIRVSIGRIEVRAATPPPAGQPAADRHPIPQLSLDEYLRSRRGGMS